MRFEEAKTRIDYSFRLNGIENLICDIRKGYLDGFTAYAEPMRGAAVLECGCMDIEVNIFSEAQIAELDEEKDDLSPVIAYFCCLKQSDGEWVSDDYLDYDPNVDWSFPNWEEQLERDMFIALDEHVRKNSYSYDHGNNSL